MVFSIILIGYLVISSIIMAILDHYGIDEFTITVLATLWPISIPLSIALSIAYSIVSLVQYLMEKA